MLLMILCRGAVVAVPKQLAPEGRLQEGQQATGAGPTAVQAHSVRSRSQPGAVSANPAVADTLLILQLH